MEYSVEMTINQTTECIIVKKVRYTIKVGHFPKGSEIEKYAKKNFSGQEKNKRLVWFAEIINPFVFGMSGNNGISRADVVSKMRKFIENGETWVATVSDWSSKR